MCFTLSLIWTFVTFVTLWAIHSHQMNMVIVISVITFFLTFLALNFVATMLTLAVDVCYVCYAMDLDTQQQHRRTFMTFSMWSDRNNQYTRKAWDPWKAQSFS